MHSAMGAFHKAGYYLPQNKRSTSNLFVLLFTRLALQGIVCYTFWGVLSGGDKPTLCKGSLWFVRSESLSVFTEKHCFCRHKSEAPRKAGQGSFTITAIFSYLYTPNTFANSYSERRIVFVRICVANGGVIF